MPQSLLQRWVVQGTLELTGPARVGSGEATERVDLPIARHPLDGKPVIQGETLAGVLRTFLREWEVGHFASEPRLSLASQLFGGAPGDPRGLPSRLIVDDATWLGPVAATEYRDHVRIEPKSGTADDRNLHSAEYLSAGQSFEIRFELVRERSDSADPLPALALVVEALETGEIRVGAGRSRGFGRTMAKGWEVYCYDYSQPGDVAAWLEGRRPAAEASTALTDLRNARTRIGSGDHRRKVSIKAGFELEDSILLRSQSQSAETAETSGTPDTVHLRSRRPGGLAYVLSGTSLKGALRQRARQIVNGQIQDGDTFLMKLLGPETGDTHFRSRLEVEESVMSGTCAVPMVQAGIKIDPWTGGTVDGALRFEQALFRPDADTPEQDLLWLTLDLLIPTGDSEWKAQAGLLLQLLKDVWTGDLPLGGATGSRGALVGRVASIRLPDECAHPIRVERVRVERDGANAPEPRHAARLSVTPTDGLKKLEDLAAAFAALLPEDRKAS
jgi:CRISPR/Cas system CMR subunit Cmr4 (Cas7 group RAMP superfamily)